MRFVHQPLLLSVVAFREIRAQTTDCFSLARCHGMWLGAVSLTGMWICAVFVADPTTMRSVLVLRGGVSSLPFSWALARESGLMCRLLLTTITRI